MNITHCRGIRIPWTNSPMHIKDGSGNIIGGSGLGYLSPAYLTIAMDISGTPYLTTDKDGTDSPVLLAFLDKW